MASENVTKTVSLKEYIIDMKGLPSMRPCWKTTLTSSSGDRQRRRAGNW